MSDIYDVYKDMYDVYEKGRIVNVFLVYDLLSLLYDVFAVVRK